MSQKSLAAAFEAFLVEHLKDSSSVLKDCISVPSLSGYLFLELEHGTVPRCGSLSDVLAKQWRERIPGAYIGKFGRLNVHKLQTALQEFLNYEFGGELGELAFGYQMKPEQAIQGGSNRYLNSKKEMAPEKEKFLVELMARLTKKDSLIAELKMENEKLRLLFKRQYNRQ